MITCEIMISLPAAEQRRRDEKPQRGDEDEQPAGGDARQRQRKIDAPERLTAARAQGPGGADERGVDALHDRQHGQDAERHHRVHHADHHAR